MAEPEPEPEQAPMSAKERELRELFDEIDTDGGGTLDRGEIKALADKLGVAMSKRELDLAMKEMDEDGSGEVDFEEFAEWWPQQEAKNSALVAAMNDRWSGALKRAQELRREKQDQTEAQRALEAVAKSHATMMRQVNDAEEKNKLLKQAIVQLKEELQESSDQRAAERESANDASEDYEAQIRALIEKSEEQQRQLARAASVLETEQTRREQDVRTLSLAHEDLQAKIERKDIRIEALVGQVEGLEWQLRQARSENQSERERTGQVQADMERIREKVNREKQGDVARREDQVTTCDHHRIAALKTLPCTATCARPLNCRRSLSLPAASLSAQPLGVFFSPGCVLTAMACRMQITRLLGTLERMRSKEQVLLEELAAMTSVRSRPHGP